MRIQDGSESNTGIMQIGRLRDTEDMPGLVGTRANRGDRPEFPKSGNSRENDDAGSNGRFSNNMKTPSGNVIDYDPNRVRRFVQRFAWPEDTPNILKDIDDFRSEKIPVFSWDGDRAEFNPEGTQNKNDKAPGYGDIGESSPIEPKGECSTCDSRRYVDKSDDASVSYQTPTKLNPQTAALAVGAHEREHVFNERAKADREGREIVSQTVSIKYAVCPECNIMYPSGGTTRTRSIKSSESSPSDMVE